MGNRAVITTAPFKASNVGIYVHWNGGRASIDGFLQACKALGYRSPQFDPTYGMAQLTRVIATFFGDGLSVGIGRCSQLDCINHDNGVYLIGGDWEIVGRKYNEGTEEVNEEKTEKIRAAIVHKISAAVAADVDAADPAMV